jgi:hypothetical protein
MAGSMTSGGDLLRIVADEIANYLYEHPDAADTEEGIQRWWLSPACGAPSLEMVRLALEALERRGVITKTTVIGGRLVHRRSVAQS